MATAIPHRARSHQPMRLTTRGRIVLASLLAGAALGLMGAVGQFSADAAAGPATAVVVVEAGDSLWSIAQRAHAGQDPRATIWQIKELNGLADSVVHVGQALVVPTR